MSIIDTLSDLLSQAAVKLHLRVLSNNTVTDSPNNSRKHKTVTRQSDKRRLKIKNVDKSSHQTNTVINNPTYVLQLPPEIFNGGVPAELKPLVDAYAEKEIAYVGSGAQNIAKSVNDFEKNPHIRSLLIFFKDKLSLRDFSLLRSGLYLKHLRETNVEEAKKEWQRILKNDSYRDKRIINLAGADYFNTYFRPLYKTLVQEMGVEKAPAEFRRQFEKTIDDMHFVVFVNSEMTVGQIVTEVKEKAEKNIRYGVRDEVIYIHAAGHDSVSNVKEAIKLLKEIYPNIKTSIKSGGKFLRARVFYRDTDN